MNKKRFDGRLYREGLRQTRTIGLTFMVLMSVTGILGSLSIALSQRWGQGDGELIRAVTVDLQDICGIMPLAMYFMVPIMLLFLFRFLTKRNASDFYHAIPQTRLCLGLSFFLSVMTWTAAAVLVSSGVIVSVCLLLSRYLLLNLSSVLPVIVNTLAGCLLVAGGMLIAASLTGTTFSALLMGAMILILPRLILTSGRAALLSLNGMFVERDFLPWLSAEFNVPAGLLLQAGSFLFGAGHTPLIFTSLWPALYSSLLGLLYAGFGLLLFCRRRSEAASNAAVSRRVQALNRISFSMLFCILPMTWITEILCGESGFFSFIEAGIFYVLAILAYFLYELITTRSARTIPKILPGLGLLVGVNAALILVLTSVYNIESSFCPTADQMKSVSISSEYYMEEDDDYFRTMSSEVEIKNPEAFRLVGDCLEKAVKDEQEVNLGSTNQNTGRYYSLVVRIRSTRGERVRRLIFREKQYERLSEILSETPEYRKIFMELPDPEKEVAALSFEGIDYANPLTEEKARKIYASLREEVSRMEFSDWWTNCLEGDGAVGWLKLTVKTEGRFYSLSLPVTADQPETLAITAAAFNETRLKDKAALLDFGREMTRRLEAGESFEQILEGRSFDLWGDCWGGGMADESFYVCDEESLGEAIRLLTEEETGDCWILMQLSRWEENPDSYEECQSFCYFFRVDSRRVSWEKLGIGNETY